MPVFDQCDFDLLPGWRWWCDGAYEPPILADIICEQPLMTGGECVELKFKTKAPRPWTHTHIQCFCMLYRHIHIEQI